MPERIFASGLGSGPANFSPLTPLRFLSRSAAIYPERTAIIHGPRRISYREFDTRSRRLVPRTVVFGPLPTTATGKIQKFELRQRVRAL
jgi:fatty-acyl-CoA synthase